MKRGVFRGGILHVLLVCVALSGVSCGGGAKGTDAVSQEDVAAADLTVSDSLVDDGATPGDATPTDNDAGNDSQQPADTLVDLLTQDLLAPTDSLSEVGVDLDALFDAEDTADSSSDQSDDAGTADSSSDQSDDAVTVGCPYTTSSPVSCEQACQAIFKNLEVCPDLQTTLTDPYTLSLLAAIKKDSGACLSVCASDSTGRNAGVWQCYQAGPTEQCAVKTCSTGACGGCSWSTTQSVSCSQACENMAANLAVCPNLGQLSEDTYTQNLIEQIQSGGGVEACTTACAADSAGMDAGLWKCYQAAPSPSQCSIKTCKASECNLCPYTSSVVSCEQSCQNLNKNLEVCPNLPLTVTDGYLKSVLAKPADCLTICAKDSQDTQTNLWKCVQSAPFLQCAVSSCTVANCATP